MDNTGSRESGSLGLGIYIEALKKWKRFIGVFVGASLAASVALCFMLPKKYEARASVMPPQQSDLSGLAAVSPDLASLAGGLLGMQSTTDVWIGVLKSNAVKDAVIERFNLREAYEAESIEDAREELDGNIVIEKSREDIVSVSVEDADPRKAADMANAFIEELDRVNKTVSMSSGGRAKSFLEGQLKETSRTLAVVEEKLRAFQKEHHALKLDDQSEALIESYGGLKGALMAKQVELQTFLSFATAQNPRAQVLRAEIAEINNKLLELESGTTGGFIIPASRYPDLMIEYGRILREVKIQQTLFELLTQQYELSRLQEAKDSPTVQSLDTAAAPEKASKPNKPVIVILGTMASLFAAVFLSLFFEFKDHVLKRLL